MNRFTGRLFPPAGSGSQLVEAQNHQIFEASLLTGKSLSRISSEGFFNYILPL